MLETWEDCGNVLKHRVEADYSYKQFELWQWEWWEFVWLYLLYLTDYSPWQWIVASIRFYMTWCDHLKFLEDWVVVIAQWCKIRIKQPESGECLCVFFDVLLGLFPWKYIVLSILLHISWCDHLNHFGRMGGYVGSTIPTMPIPNARAKLPDKKNIFW